MKSKSLNRILVFILILASVGIRIPGGSPAAAAPVEPLAPDAVSPPCGSDLTQVGCWLFEEGSGTSTADGSGNGNTGTLFDSTMWTTDRFGNAVKALHFNGTSQFVKVSDSTSLDISGDITIAAWVKPEEVKTQDVVKKAVTTGTTVPGYELDLSSSTGNCTAGFIPCAFGRFNYAGTDTYRIDTKATYAATDTWTHYVVTYTSLDNTLRIYKNGTISNFFVPASALTIASNSLFLGFGAQLAGTIPTASRYFTGALDDIRLYKRALSAAEIKALANDIVPSGYSCTNLDSKAGSANTEHKPMSKVWFYEDKWWSVFPATTGVSESGSWLWRLDGSAWTPVFRLSATTSAKADVKPAGSPVGSVVHVLLYSGGSSELASVEYNAGVYQAWSSRPGLTTLSLPGSETATIDIDSTGRMWLNSQQDVTGSRDILIYYSDSPYTTWSSAITIATGTLRGDDISLVTALPNNTIGVLWSNQNTRLFGFKYHKDTDPASTWSAEEQPTSLYDPSKGAGFADDHMNVATASDGTLYAAVKTGYDTGGFPKIALLVRRLSGTSGGGIWDPDIYNISYTGTRGIVLLDEAASTVSVFYTSTEGGGDILYTQTAIQPIFFGSVQTMRSGTNNDVSSTKQNINGALVAIYSNGTTINGSSCTSIPVGGVDLAITKTDGKTVAVPGDATSYTIVVSNGSTAAISGATVTDVFPAELTGVSWTCTPGAGSSCTGSGSGNINDSVNLAAGGFVTYSVSATIAPTAGYIVNNTATVEPPVGISDPDLTNNEATDSTALRTGVDYCGSDANLVACYQLDEGGGNVYLDEVQNTVYNDGLTVNSPAWVTGRIGQALSFNGSSQYGYAPDHLSLDIENQITLAAWIKPTVNGTQYLVKKGIRNTASGYELSLATATTSTGAFFFRINDNTTCRVDSTIPYANYFGSWVHVAATYDHINLHIYVNGVQVDDALTPCAVNIISNSNVLAIGAQSDGTSNFTGSMDDVRVYNRALSAAEIEALFLQPTAASLVNLSALPQPDSILIGWQTLQEVGLTGFDLYRAETRYGDRVKINSQQIPAKNPGKMVGENYEYLDATVEIGKTYFYWAEWVGLSSKTLVGPVTGSLLQNALWLPVVRR